MKKLLLTCLVAGVIGNANAMETCKNLHAEFKPIELNVTNSTDKEMNLELWGAGIFGIRDKIYIEPSTIKPGEKNLIIKACPPIGKSTIGNAILVADRNKPNERQSNIAVTLKAKTTTNSEPSDSQKFNIVEKNIDLLSSNDGFNDL